MARSFRRRRYHCPQISHRRCQVHRSANRLRPLLERVCLRTILRFSPIPALARKIQLRLRRREYLLIVRRCWHPRTRRNPTTSSRSHRIPKMNIRMLRCVEAEALKRRRKTQSGLTLVELIVAFSILLILTTMATPMARYQVRRQRERELSEDLVQMRKAIDKYKDMCDQGKVQSGGTDTYCYPPTLEILVDGAKMANTVSGNNQSGKMRFLRHIPKDPMTGDKDWGKRSMQDEPTSSSWGGQNVFDVYSKTMDKAGDGTPYAEW